MATAPIYAATIKQWHGRVAAANTNRDGSGSLVDVVTAGASGSRVDRIRACAEVTTTAGIFRIWLYNGSAYRLLHEELVSAITPSTTVAAWEFERVFSGGLQLPTTWKLAVTMHNNEAVNVFAEGGDY